MNIFIILSIVIILLINSIVESKRSFSIGRSRPKSGVPSVRRKSSSMNVDSVSHDSSINSNARPIGWNGNGGGGGGSGSAAASGPIGPPPPYPGLGRSHSSSNVNIAPPAYSPNSNLPPSYSSLYGAGGNHYQSYGSNYGYGGGGSASTSNIGKIPPRGTPLNIDTTSFHGLGTSHSASGANGLYNRHGSNGAGYGYGYGNHQSSIPFSYGSILTGLAAWNLARGYNSYNRPQHVYIHKQNNNTKDNQPNSDMIPTNTEMISTISTSNTTKYSSDINNNNNNNNNTTNSARCLNSTCGNDKFYIDELNNGENITGKPLTNSTII